MGSHRADVGAERQAVEATSSEPISTGSMSYGGAGKRRAQPTAESVSTDTVKIAIPVTPAAPYTGAGKRRALVVDEPAPVAAAPTAVLVPSPMLAQGSQPETEHIPVPRLPVERTVEVTLARGLGDTYDLGDSLRPLFAEDTRTDLPRIDLEALELAVDGVSDFTGETTTKLPKVAPSGKRRAPKRVKTARGRRFRVMPSVPMLCGLAAMAVAGGGAISAAHHPLGSKASQLVAASPFSGASDVGSLGAERTDGVSRNDDRAALADQAESAAQERAQTLTQLDQKATGQDQWLSSNQWTTPIAFGDYRVTGHFGDVSGPWSTPHPGMDFAAPTGTPIRAVANGVITFFGYDQGGYGNKTVETLPDGTELWYAHQSAFAVTEGERVTEGEIIGYVGDTGYTTGPHVHLEVHPGGGDAADPDAALRAHGVDPDAHGA